MILMVMESINYDGILCWTTLNMDWSFGEDQKIYDIKEGMWITLANNSFWDTKVLTLSREVGL